MIIPVFVIALDESQRFLRLKKDLAANGIKFSRIQAIEGKSLTIASIHEKVNLKSCMSRMGVKISKQLIGCALSHKKVYEQFLTQSSNWALILEEDVRLGDDFHQVISDIEDGLRFQGPTIVQLFTRGERFVSRKEFSDLESNYQFFKFSSTPGQAAAYLINREAASLALTYPKIDGPSDWPNWSARVAFMGVFPFCVSENGDESSIGSTGITTFRYRMRVLEVVLGIHYFRYMKMYPSASAYFKINVKPIFNRLIWRLHGQPTHPKNDMSGLWLV